MRKSYIRKRVFWLIGIAATAIAVLMVWMNFVLIIGMPVLQEKFSVIKDFHVSFRRVFYVFPNVFVFKDVSAIKKYNNGSLRGAAEYAVVGLSPVDPFTVSRLHFINPHLISSEETPDLFIERQINNVCRFFGSRNFSFSMSNARWDHLRRDKTRFFDVVLKSRNKKFAGRYCVNREADRSKTLEFSVNGQIKGQGFTVDGLRVSDQKESSARLWGYYIPDKLYLEGYALLGERSGIGGASSAKVHVLDIDSIISFNGAEIDLNRIAFSWNGIPVELMGQIDLAPLHPAGDFWLRSRSSTASTAHVQVRGEFVKAGLKGEGYVKIEREAGRGLKSIEMSIPDLAVVVESLSAFRACAPSAEADFNIAGRQTVFQFEEIVFYSRDEGDEKIMTMDASFYSGRWHTELRQNADSFEIKLNINDSQLALMKGFDFDSSGISGEVFANFHWERGEEADWQGEGGIKIMKGRLSGLESLDWFAEYFDMKSMQDVLFEEISSDFLLHPEGISLTELTLKSDKANVQGYAHYSKRQMVNSKINVEFCYALMAESGKFRSLMRRMRNKSDPVEFVFRFAGDIGHVNFQWAQNDFKKTAVGVIPNFVKRKIERRVAEAVK